MEELIIQACSHNGKVKNSELLSFLAQHGQAKNEDIAQALNSLLGKGKITISEEKGETVYQMLSEKSAISMKKLEGLEAVILQIVREAGENGVWNGEIKKKTEIPIVQINKILMNLFKQNLVFSKKAVNQNKKLWFIEGIAPSKEVTGGFLFEEQAFDNSFMNELQAQVKLLLSDKPCTLKEVFNSVKQQVNKNIQEENLKEVVESMKALGEIQENQGVYSVINSFAIDPLIVPCIGCSLRFECRADGVINPNDCEYLNSWLDF